VERKTLSEWRSSPFLSACIQKVTKNKHSKKRKNRRYIFVTIINSSQTKPKQLRDI